MLNRIFSGVKGFVWFIFVILFGFIASGFWFSALVSWGWQSYSYLRFGFYDHSVEIWVQANLKPHFYIGWIGVGKILEAVIDFLYIPFVRFVIGGALGALAGYWTNKMDDQ